MLITNKFKQISVYAPVLDNNNAIMKLSKVNFMKGFRSIFERGEADFAGIVELTIAKNLTKPQPKILEILKSN